MLNSGLIIDSLKNKQNKTHAPLIASSNEMYNQLWSHFNELSLHNLLSPFDCLHPSRTIPPKALKPDCWTKSWITRPHTCAFTIFLFSMSTDFWLSGYTQVLPGKNIQVEILFCGPSWQSSPGPGPWSSQAHTEKYPWTQVICIKYLKLNKFIFQIKYNLIYKNKELSVQLLTATCCKLEVFSSTLVTNRTLDYNIVSKTHSQVRVLLGPSELGPGPSIQKKPGLGPGLDPAWTQYKPNLFTSVHLSSLKSHSHFLLNLNSPYRRFLSTWPRFYFSLHGNLHLKALLEKNNQHN